MTAQDPLLITAVFAINTIVFLLYGYDKQQAQRREWRISERVLLLSSIAGPFGAFAGMQFFRHKTKKTIFLLSIPLFLLMQVAGFLLLIGWTW
ncbi:DUF1294 domain-containing protein [Methanosphaerula palustris]|uniref:DUF1294 domain-containing protein n=1 Tax=Methanosphaerula palustris (strain ATCC BAA-1556 / DSM 19958 / E1-9c) TaxID=521011 RepID=B8GG08_METPE|nr:DUF1294 domain-containing protein [Methanosphaerula palustris]ACL16082.1 protein of unknown function DUF1294 [Methanosphaerula palustris E1-9c]